MTCILSLSLSQTNLIHPSSKTTTTITITTSLKPKQYNVNNRAKVVIVVVSLRWWWWWYCPCLCHLLPPVPTPSLEPLDVPHLPRVYVDQLLHAAVRCCEHVNLVGYSRRHLCLQLTAMSNGLTYFLIESYFLLLYIYDYVTKNILIFFNFLLYLSYCILSYFIYFLKLFVSPHRSEGWETWLLR